MRAFGVLMKWVTVGALLALGATTALANPLATQRWKTVAGAAKTKVIFLHGLGGGPDSDVAARLLHELKQRGESVEMIAPWLRPVKLGVKGIEDAGLHTMSDQLERARKIIKETDGPVVLMGHSFGGKAALQLEKEFKGKVVGVVGLAPSVKNLYAHWKYLTGERGLPADRKTIEARLDQHDAELKQLFARADLKERHNIHGAIEFNQTMKDLAAHDETKMEGAVHAPTLVLHGQEDEAVSIHYIRRFAEGNKKVKLVEIAGVDHGFLALKGHKIDREKTNEATKLMADELVKFLKAL